MLPVPLDTKPMLARLRDDIPRGEEWIYEPKWDGFRALVFKDGDDVTIVSRDGRSLGRYFPELLTLFEAELGVSVVMDGEVVIEGPGGLDFGALLQRIHPAASRIRRLATDTPASFVAFDLLAYGDIAVMDDGFAERRRRLEEILGHRPSLPAGTRATRLLVTPQTGDVDEARRWFDELDHVGLDGIIAKPRDLAYKPGERVMTKIKHVRTADCVVGGYRLAKSGDGIGSLLLGLYDRDATLHYVGHTSSFKSAQRRDLLERLRPLEGGAESFGQGRTPGGPSRWSAGRDPGWTPVAPVLVCEVRFDRMQGERFRHAARFLRWRADRDPRSCTFDQLERAPR